jgi:hypothetical protein
LQIPSLQWGRWRNRMLLNWKKGTRSCSHLLLLTNGSAAFVTVNTVEARADDSCAVNAHTRLGVLFHQGHRGLWRLFGLPS